MDVSNFELELNGQELIQKVIELTGLPDDLVRKELNQILEDQGTEANELTMQNLREALAAHLEALGSEIGSAIDVL